MDDAAAARWLREHGSGAAARDALAFFDDRPAVDLAGMTGRWRGVGLPTGHPFDGLLEAYGWYGKEVVDAETVHPLLFRDGAGLPHPLDPAYIPLGLLRRFPGLARTPMARLGFAGVRPLRRTDEPAARLRMVEHRGVVSAALVYDRLPVIDVFRRIAAGTVLGLMDLRDVAQPFFFVLERDED
jgi:Domain of unknown function (DUF4334)/GXWXG protein